MGNISLLASQPDFVRLVAALSPQDRGYLHFPAVGDDYYTPVTLRELERVYPGWESSGEYRAAAKDAVNPLWRQRARGILGPKL